MNDIAMISRRRLIQFAAASPLLAAAPGLSVETPIEAWPDPTTWAPGPVSIADPGEAINVFDFELAMRSRVPPAHFGYMATGVDGEQTLRANREAFRHFTLWPRRMVDVRRASLGTRLMGMAYDSPIVLAPTGGNLAFHPEGEIAVARAARSGNHLMVLSTTANAPIEKVIEARGAPVWFHLSPTSSWPVANAMMKRAERAGAPVVVLTVDRAGGSRNLETLARLRRLDTRNCSACHDNSSFATQARRLAIFDGIDLQGVTMAASMLDWDFVKRMRDATTMRIFLKGIVTGADARLAVEHGVDGIVVSNHGGRSEDGGPGTIDALPEVVAAVKGRVPVFVDGGFRRGADIVKALCLGATAIQIGRPYLWGLGSFGQPGVERVLELLRSETLLLMKQMGANDVGALMPSMVRPSHA